MLTKHQEKLINASVAIATEPAAGDDLAFLHAILCQVGLPRSKVDGGNFMRKSGDAWLSVQAGWLDEGRGPVQQPVPYGAMPRLALAWVSTYAVRHKTRKIDVGDSARDFLRLLGMDGDGRRHGTLRKQMHALAACRLQLGYKGRTYNGQPIAQFDAWVVDKNKAEAQKTLWPGELVLSEGYYNSLIDAAVPLDNRALHALKGSALALDMYVWLAHRLHRLSRPVVVSWSALKEQFGQEYKDMDYFKKEFKRLLPAVLAAYPQARVDTVTGGLRLLASPAPISPASKPALRRMR